MNVCICAGHRSDEQFTPDASLLPLGATDTVPVLERAVQRSSTPVYWRVLTLPDVLPVLCKLSADYLRSKMDAIDMKLLISLVENSPVGYLPCVPNKLFFVLSKILC